MFKDSARDHGTLRQLCGLLGRHPAAKDPKKDMNACVDFLMAVVKGHYITAACQILGIEDPQSEIANIPNPKCTSVEERREFVYSVAKSVVDKCGLVDNALLLKDDATEDEHKDGIHSYTRCLCHFASLVIEFLDAWSEGDGDRICRCWKIFMLHFHEGKQTKYALQVLRIQFQLVELSPSLAHQLKWNRFVNYKGGRGTNIPCDLHNEHINRSVKGIINHMGANLSESAVRRAGQSITMIEDIINNFDKCTNVPYQSSTHSTRSDEKDVMKIVGVVKRNKLLHFNPLSHLKKQHLLHWIVNKQCARINWECVFGAENVEEEDNDNDTDNDT